MAVGNGEALLLRPAGVRAACRSVPHRHVWRKPGRHRHRLSLRARRHAPDEDPRAPPGPRRDAGGDQFREREAVSGPLTTLGKSSPIEPRSTAPPPSSTPSACPSTLPALPPPLPTTPP